MSYSIKECGGCTMCCRGSLTVQVNEHKVYPGCSCPHVTESGCGIFDDPSRPPVCDGYSCAWASLWFFPEWMRPDRCGFVLTITGSDSKVVALTPTFNEGDTVDGASLLWVMNWAKHNDLTIVFTVRSPDEEETYFRGSVFNHPDSFFVSGNKSEVFNRKELFLDDE